MTRSPGRTGLGGWLVAVWGATIVLHLAGAGPLAAPPLAEPSALDDWFAQREPLVAAMALLRLVALAVAWYLLATSVLGLALRMARAARLVRLADKLTIPAVRRLLVSAAGVTLASGVSPSLALTTGPMLPAAVALPAPSSAAAAGQLGSSTTTTTTPTPTTPPTLTMRLLTPDGPSPTPGAPASQPVPAQTPPPAAAMAATTPSSALPASETWRVRPGECFWSIAEDVLARARSRAPSDAEIVPYWRALIEANRAALADRSNPDLVFPGQVFTVPAVPPG